MTGAAKDRIDDLLRFMTPEQIERVLAAVVEIDAQRRSETPSPLAQVNKPDEHDLASTPALTSEHASGEMFELHFAKPLAALRSTVQEVVDAMFEVEAEAMAPADLKSISIFAEKVYNAGDLLAPDTASSGTALLRLRDALRMSETAVDEAERDERVLTSARNPRPGESEEQRVARLRSSGIEP